MRIGVVSDTHNNLRSVRAIVEIFDRAGVDRVVHTGDVTQAKVLDAFAPMRAPLYGVWGNNDLERAALDAAAAEHEMHIVEGALHVRWHARHIVVVHDPLDLPPHLAPLAPHHPPHAARGRASSPDLALHGHTHLHREEHVDGTLVFNPGECAGMMPGHNRVGIVDLATLRCELAHF